MILSIVPTLKLEEKVGESLTKDEQKPNNYKKENYLKSWWEQKRDTIKFIPLTRIEYFPEQGFEGLYGWTYRLEGKIHLRQGLKEEKKRETDIHESIHTSDEYETRILTKWILEEENLKEKYYKTKPVY